MTATAQIERAVEIRALRAEDLPAVVDIDAGMQGRSRRDYFQRRLDAAVKEPQLHAQFAALDAKGLAGYALARVMSGEFGRDRPGLRLEVIGVRPDARGHGIGRQLMEALHHYAERHGMQDIRSTALWSDERMVRWMRARGFRLGPAWVVDAAVAANQPERDDAMTMAPTDGRDYSLDEANDAEMAARGRADVRPMHTDDLNEIVRVDTALTGRDRRDYIAARLGEAMHDSAIRVSLTARIDDAIVGHLMAKADLGDFGRTEPTAVIDTIGVDPAYAGRGVARALLGQLFANLSALRIERVETVVGPDNIDLLGLLLHCGFAPSQRITFVRDV